MQEVKSKLDPEWAHYKEAPQFLVEYKKNIFDPDMKEAMVRLLDVVWGESPKDQVRLFEQEFAHYCGKSYATMFNSALHAVYLSFKMYGIGEGDEVIVAPNVEPCNAAIIVQTGARPVFVDAEQDTLNMDVTKIEKCITSRTKAIHPIHAHGHPTNMDPVMEIARKHNLVVVEDSTHATGCKYKGRRLPIGDVGVFGMVSKCLWLPSGSAMLATDNEELNDRLRMLMSWPGRRAVGEVSDLKGKPLYHFIKSTPDNVSAAVGRIQLKRLPEYTETQRRNARTYSELLKDTPITLPVEKDYAEHNFLRYVIRTKKRDSLQRYMIKHGVNVHVIYRTPAHLYRYFREKYGYKKGDFPVAEGIKETELGLPEPTRSRTPWELEYTASKVKEFFRQSISPVTSAERVLEEPAFTEFHR